VVWPLCSNAFGIKWRWFPSETIPRYSSSLISPVVSVSCLASVFSITVQLIVVLVSLL
jgi:hypothetical protein